jgi:hypothetical protein
MPGRLGDFRQPARKTPAARRYFVLCTSDFIASYQKPRNFGLFSL